MHTNDCLVMLSHAGVNLRSGMPLPCSASHGGHTGLGRGGLVVDSRYLPF